MFFEYELKYHNKIVKSNFTADEITEIIDHAIIDLKNRNIPGSIIVPLAYLICGFGTDYASKHSSLFLFLGSILFLLSFLRIFSIVALSKKNLTEKNFWVLVFFWSNIFFAVVCAAFTASAILLYDDASSITLMILLLAGVGGGSMPSYCICRQLSFSYLFIILGIPAIAEFYVGTLISVSSGIGISFFLLFTLIQTKLWNKQYWISLINSFVIEKNILELESLNIQLTNEIAEHRKTGQEIVISRKKLHDIFNLAHDGIFIFDLEGRVLDTNQTMLRMFGVTQKEALKFDVRRSFQSELNSNIDMKAIWEDAVKGNSQEFAWITKDYTKDTLSTIQVNLKKSLWGKDYVIIATIRDISQQLAAMEATISANHAKTEFLANMSHELRTPMHGILGYARLGLKRSESLPRKKIEEYFHLINESGQRLMGLLDNILDYSKLEVGKMRYDMQNNNLPLMISEVITELTPIASEKGLRFRTEYISDLTTVCCDYEKIKQVLRNLLFNAIKCSYKNSRIDIVCEENHATGTPPGILVSICNRGIPIPSDELSIIFERFTQSTATKTGAGGTGLGLAISKRIINGHTGSIWAENDTNERTIFRFILPGSHA